LLIWQQSIAYFGYSCELKSLIGCVSRKSEMVLALRKEDSMKKLILLSLVLSSLSLAAASKNEQKILGSWDLKSFKLKSAQGVVADFCKDMNGNILYEKSGHMAVSINCGSFDEASPAHKYGGMLFYSATFKVTDGDISHTISNSNSQLLLNKVLVRKIEVLSDTKLELSGKIGNSGESLVINFEKNKSKI